MNKVRSACPLVNPLARMLGCDWLHSVWTKSLFRSIAKDFALSTSQKSWFPGCRPDDVSYRPDAHQTKASSVRTFLCIEKFQTAPACIRPNFSAARPDPSQIWEDCCNRLDALIHKVRIVIQIQPSGRQSAMVRMHIQHIWILCVEDQPFERPSPWSGRAKP